MSFKIHKTDDGRVPPYEYLPAGAITPKIGTALYVNTSGQLALATGTQKPTYISMLEAESALTAGTVIPVIRVASDIEFETVSSAAFTSIKVGNKVTLSATADSVTATTTDGVAEVTYIGGTSAGDTVRIRF